MTLENVYTGYVLLHPYCKVVNYCQQQKRGGGLTENKQDLERKHIGFFFPQKEILI